MIIAYGSDLHLEFGTKGVLDALENVDADVFVLSGDIGVSGDYEKMHNENSPKGKELKELLKRANEKFKKTFLVLGNHDHYGGEYKRNIKKAREAIAYFDNVHLLENDTYVYDDVVFFGSTMWTSMGKNPIIRNQIRTSMNDFRKIRYESAGAYKKFSPEFAHNEHSKSSQFLDDALRKHRDKTFVAVFHHAPFFDSVPYYYKNDDLSHAYYSEELEQKLLNGYFTRVPNVIIHGHIHNAQPYTKNGIDVYVNTRGYEGHEASADDFKFEVFTV